MKDNLRKYLFYSELSGLYIIAFFMPTMESVKWGGLALFLLGTLGRTILQGRVGWRKPNTFEWFLAAFLSTAFLSTLVNWPLPNGVSGLKNTFLYLLLGWLMYINRYTKTQLKYFLFAMIGGVLFGLTLGAFDFFTGLSPHLKFKSMPNVNRSVIYHLIALFTMSGILLDNNGNFSMRARIWVGACLAISLIGLIVIGSRAGIITFLTGVGLLFLSFLGNRRVRIVLCAGIVTLVIAIAAISAYVDNPMVKGRVNRFTHYYQIIKSGSGLESLIVVSDQVRYDYVRMAWAQITQKGKMLLGSGPRTFKYIKVEELEFDKPLVEYKKGWDKPTHAHNEYLTRWVEQGLLGLSVHILFLAYVGIRLFRHRSKAGCVHWQWVAILGIFNTALIAGIFNTVLTNEIAWLVMMLTGIFMQWANQSDKDGIGNDA